MSIDGLSDVFTPLINVEGLMISEGSIHSNTLRYRDIIAIARIKQIRFFLTKRICCYQHYLTLTVKKLLELVGEQIRQLFGNNKHTVDYYCGRFAKFSVGTFPRVRKTITMKDI